MGANVRGQEGNNPDLKLRSLIFIKCQRSVILLLQLISRLGNSHLLKIT